MLARVARKLRGAFPLAVVLSVTLLTTVCSTACSGVGPLALQDTEVTPTDMEDTIVPPFWARWWFRGLIALVLVGSAIGGYRLRVRSVEARSRELETQVANRTKELAALNAIAAAVSRSLDLREILSNALGETLQVMEIETGGIYLLDEEAGVLTIAAHRGFSPQFVAEIDRLRVGEGFSGRVTQSGEPLVVRDVSADPRLTRMVVKEEGLRSVAIVPLSSRGKVLGTLFAVTQSYRQFTEQDVQLLTSIGHQIGMAIENARLYEDTKDRLAQLTALQETTTAVASTLELDELLNLITQQATTLLQADGGILNLVDWERSEDEVVASTGLGVPAMGGRVPLEGGLSGWVTLHNQPTISNRLQDDSRVYRRGLARVEEETKRQIQNAAVAPLTIKGQVIGTLVVIDKQWGKGEFDQSDLDLLVAFANQAATAIEKARMFEAEQRRAEQFRVISEVGRQITSILDIDEVLVQVVRLIQQAFDYYHVGIALIEGDRAVYQVGAGDLWDDPQFQFQPPGLKVGQEGITGWVAGTGEPLLARDVGQEPRYVWMQGSKTRSELAVPIRAKGQVIGVLDVQSDRLDAFDESDLAMLQSLAHQAAIAIDNARLFERAQQAAVVQERSRLARELHDSVTQSLYSSTLLAEAGQRLARAGDLERTEEYLGRLGEITQQALKEMRLLVYQLRPLGLREVGLVGALQQRLDAVERRAGVEARLAVEGELELPEGMEEELYRIAQEALNNALKHAAPASVAVTIRADAEHLELEVADDGRGFAPQAVSDEGGMGLTNMRERAEKLGGALQVISAPGEGTRVRISVGTHRNS